MTSAKSVLLKVSKHTRFPISLIKKPQNIDHRDARQLAALLMHRGLGLSSTQVGKFFNADHGSVLYWCRKIIENPDRLSEAVKLQAELNAEAQL